jgi:hypothetical protein
MPPLPDEIILVLTPSTPLFLHRLWLHAQFWLGGAMLTPGTQAVMAALGVMGWARELYFTNDSRLANRML